MKLAAAPVAVVCAALALAGCPSSRPATATHSAATVAEFCAGLIDAYSSKLGRCELATPAYLAAYGGEFESSCASLDAFVAAGLVRWSAADAGRCLDAIDAAACDGIDHAFELDPGCVGMVTGTIAPGAACRTTSECAGGTCDTTATCSGTCVAWLRQGDACTGGAGECGAGLGCDDATGTCLPLAPGADGQPCGPGGDVPCRPGLWCDAGTCRAKRTSGSCLYPDAYGSCAVGTACDETWGTTPRAECVPIVPLGSTCGLFVARCGAGAFCDPVDGRCRADRALGQPCSADAPCETGLWCEAGTCAAGLALGAPCTAYDQCGSQAWCDRGGTDTCVTSAVCTP